VIAATAAGTAVCAGKSYSTKDTVVGETRFLKLISRDWVDHNGVARKWDLVQRAGTPGVVSVFPILHSKSFAEGDEETLLTCQFKPPCGYALEFPAAIVDAGESIEQCALRTVENETGYTGKVRLKSAPMASSAGLTDEKVSLVIVDVNLDDYTSADTSVTKKVGKKRRGIKKTVKVPGQSWIPDQNLTDDQSIVLHRIKIKDMKQEIAQAQSEGITPWVGLQALALGLDICGHLADE